MKHNIKILVASVLLLACNSPESKVSVQSENEKIVRQYYEYFNNLAWEKMADALL